MRGPMNYSTSAVLIAIALLVLVQSESASGLQCRQEERLALLEIKAQLSFPIYSTEGEWEGDDCCQWERVTCDPITGHVTKLDLGLNLEIGDGDGHYYHYDSNLLLNASIFLPLQQLRSLSLYGHGISGFITGAGLERWYNLNMLEILDLSANNLGGSILYPLANVSSLRTLKLSDNINIGAGLRIKGFESWTNLTKMEMLDLSYNDLPSSVISSLAKVSSLRALYLDFNTIGETSVKELHALNLKVLSLRGCISSGSFPYLGHWSSLKALSLADSNLNDNLTSKGLCDLKNLEELDLSHNRFTGNLPLCIANLSSLRLLDLSHNQFQVTFPSFIFERLIFLRYISLSQNQLEGTLSLRSFLNHSNLEVLRLATKALNFRVEVVNLSFQLVDLELANCILDVESNFLFSQQKLQSLDLSNTHSKGLLPVTWLLQNNFDLFQLDLHKNLFTGPIQLPFLAHEKLSMLDISHNKLGGELPIDIISRLPNLLLLNLSQNCFQGPLPFLSTNRVLMLDISNNNLTEDIKSSFSKIMSHGPPYMDLSKNNFYGSFPENMNFTAFDAVFKRVQATLLLNDNNISGTIPFSICNTSLQVLDISRNELNGFLPDCIGRAELSVLKLSGNRLEGSLPSEIYDMPLWILDLSDNMFSGSIPPCYNQSTLNIVDLSKNNLTGNFPITWLNISDLIAISIQKNYLSGELSIFNVTNSNLNMLQASKNQFEGNISGYICQLIDFLNIIDLSQNNLSGKIPSCFSNNRPWYRSAYDSQMELNVSSSSQYEYDFFLGRQRSYDHFFLHPENGVSFHGEQLTNFGLEFMSKGRLDYYWKEILQIESVIDLSSNKLGGNIPEEIGLQLSVITLNLSNNHFTGVIPDSICYLSQLESLDLSHNSLTGEIPRDLTELTSLGYFSVAYNNLSGPTLEGKQFNTFDNSSYEGNPNLCGPPLSKRCFYAFKTTNETNDDQKNEGTDDYLIFFSSFCLSFLISFWSIIAVLSFRRNWHHALFSWVDLYGDMIYVRIVLSFRKKDWCLNYQG